MQIIKRPKFKVSKINKAIFGNRRILIYDIETSKVAYRAFSGGETVLRHTQLRESSLHTPIICISAKWYGERDSMLFTGDTAVKEFLAVVKTADLLLGKNNHRFDNKHVKTWQMLLKVDPTVQLDLISDDLESQLRKNFTFQSYSLDHVAKLLVGVGKDKMEDKDWNNIQDLLEVSSIEHCLYDKDAYCKIVYRKPFKKLMKDGTAAQNKMYMYNVTDIERTEQVLSRVSPYIKLKNSSPVDGRTLSCLSCGSTTLFPDRTVVMGTNRYQLFTCSSCNGYAGRAILRYSATRNKVFGKMIK